MTCTSLFKQMRRWLDDRFAMTPILDFALFRRVSKSPWYFGAGAAMLLLLATLIVTGSFLALSYTPAPRMALASVQRLSQDVPAGWFLRGLHYWSAGMMVVCLIYHMLRQITLGGYKPPRESIWFVGCALFVLVMTNAYTGYTLRWDERGTTAVRVLAHMLYNVPVIGESLVRIVQGGESVSASTLSRYYAVHVLFVPLSLLFLVSFHLYLVIMHGVTTHAERRRPMSSAKTQREVHERVKQSPVAGTDFYPWTAAKSAAFAMTIFALVLFLTLTVGAPPPGPESFTSMRAVPEEEWWFHWVSGLVALLPGKVAPLFYVVFPIGLILTLLALPLIDRGANRGARHRPLAVLAVALVVTGILGLSGYRLQSPFRAWPQEGLPALPPGVELTPSAAQGQRLFARFGCSSCHAIGGAGSSFGPNLTALPARLSREELEHYIGRPREASRCQPTKAD